jgi:hypothetical protein
MNPNINIKYISPILRFKDGCLVGLPALSICLDGQKTNVIIIAIKHIIISEETNNDVL